MKFTSKALKMILYYNYLKDMLKIYAHDSEKGKTNNSNEVFIDDIIDRLDGYCAECDTSYDNLKDHIIEEHLDNRKQELVQVDADNIEEDVVYVFGCVKAKREVIKKNNKVEKVLKIIGFDANKLAEEIILENEYYNDKPLIALDSEDLYVYDNGVYRYLDDHDIIRLIELKAKRALYELQKTRLNYKPQLVNDTLTLLKNKVAYSRKIFDILNIINCKNGIVDLDTLELKKHTPALFSRIQFNAHYIERDEELKYIGKEIKEYLITTIPNEYERAKLLEALATIFLEDIHKAIMLVGPGASGKSTLLKIIEAMIGSDYVSHVSIHDLEFNRFKPAELDGKILNIFADIKSGELSSTSILKALITHDPITVERKNKHPFDLYFRGKLIFSANELPEVYDTSDAWFRRWIIIKFEQQFINGNAKNDLAKIIINKQDNLDWLFSVLIRIAHKIKKEGYHLKYAESIDETREEWLQKANPIEQFLKDHYERDVASKIPKELVYSKYVEWCRDNNKPPRSKQKFNQQVERVFGAVSIQAKINGKNVKVWQGIREKEEVAKVAKVTEISYSVTENSDDDVEEVFKSYLAYEEKKEQSLNTTSEEKEEISREELEKSVTSATSATLSTDNKETTKITKIPTWLVPNHKNNINRVFCKICNESCYPSIDDLEVWAREHSNLFHKDVDEEYTEIEINNDNSNERLYSCDICGALYKEEKNYKNHLALYKTKEIANKHANYLKHNVIEV